jgi:hypothetical protein
MLWLMNLGWAATGVQDTSFAIDPQVTMRFGFAATWRARFCFDPRQTMRFNV